MDKKFIKEIQGREFILHEGLLNEFHVNGGKEIFTEKLPSDPGMYIFKATVTGTRGSFSGHGDAHKGNVNPMIAPHAMRMAETRAINRALRFYNNIGMCSVDELGEGGETLEEKIAVFKPVPPSPRQVEVVRGVDLPFDESGEAIPDVAELGKCPICKTAYHMIPAGTTKTGKSYSAFAACGTRGCKGKKYSVKEMQALVAPPPPLDPMDF
jgi:hypothetical protein